MSNDFIFLAAPFCLGLLLVAIHSYLGLHVLERDVIFIDISLSQIAALGSAFALYFFGEGHEGLELTLSLSLCLIASLFLAFFRKFEERISQEVVVGITYALASSALILVANHLAHGAEHLKEAFVGNILFVTWDQVIETAIIYGVISIIHYVFRHQFWECSRKQSTSIKWDFLFYLLFGVVITFSTRHAGVLVVFSLLITPAALAKRFTQDIKRQLFIAWGMGTLGLLLAFAVSLWWDWPSGAALVAILTSSFFIIWFFTRIRESLRT